MRVVCRGRMWFTSADPTEVKAHVVAGQMEQGRLLQIGGTCGHRDGHSPLGARQDGPADYQLINRQSSSNLPAEHIQDTFDLGPSRNVPIPS